MKTKRKYHDDDIFDDDGLLKDGKALRVKLTMADGDTVHNALQRALQERDNGPMRVVDGFSRGRDSTAMHRPGYRTFDGDDAWEHQKARMYADYNRDLQDAYKGPGVRNDSTPTRDPVADARQRYNDELTSAWAHPVGMGTVPGRDAARPDDDEDYDDNMQLCVECGGSGEDDDGGECETCGGTGLVTHGR